MSPLAVVGAGVLGVMVGMAVVTVIEIINAPEGYQDENGFHYGKQPNPDEHPEEWAEWEDPRE